MNNFTKSLTTLLVTGGTIFGGATATLAGGYYTYGHSKTSDCSNCYDVHLPASSSHVNLTVPGAKGYTKSTTTTGKRVVVLEDVYHWDVIVKPKGVTSKVVDVQSSGTTAPCTLCK